jgi:SIR2-like protein/TIR domain-containing protein
VSADTDPSEIERRAFVSYRRSDSPSAARQIADALKQRLGGEQVFFDTQDLHAGFDWHAAIAARVGQAEVVVAVIGPRWLSLADERGRRTVLAPEEEDVLRLEIETALRGAGRVIPVLVDGATMPSREALPRPFKPMARLQAVPLRHDSWEGDLSILIDLVTSEGPAPSIEPDGGAAPPEELPETWEPIPGGPDDYHYEGLVADLEDGTVVPVLGAGVFASPDNSPWEPGSGRLPTASELSEALATRFRLRDAPAKLAEVSQQVVAVKGARDLDRALRELLLAGECPPTELHRFLARLPALLRARGREAYPLIVTTTYDSALERAFDEAREPYDLAVFITSGEHRGRFLHIPWWEAEGREAQPIAVPNEYVDFPIDEEGVLERPIILKIHGGALHDAPAGLRLPQGFVITEDDYIGFLSDSPVSSLVPLQLLNKLRDSHLLFLGYGVRDWHLRVFVRRVWPGGEPGSHSWAIQEHGDRVDGDFWRKLNVERLQVAIRDYLHGLAYHLRP